MNLDLNKLADILHSCIYRPVMTLISTVSKQCWQRNAVFHLRNRCLWLLQWQLNIYSWNAHVTQDHLAATHMSVINIIGYWTNLNFNLVVLLIQKYYPADNHLVFFTKHRMVAKRPPPGGYLITESSILTAQVSLIPVIGIRITL